MFRYLCYLFTVAFYVAFMCYFFCLSMSSVILDCCHLASSSVFPLDFLSRAAQREDFVSVREASLLNVFVSFFAVSFALENSSATTPSPFAQKSRSLKEPFVQITVRLKSRSSLTAKEGQSLSAMLHDLCYVVMHSYTCLLPRTSPAFRL